MGPYTLRNKAATLRNRIALAPIATKAGFYDGRITADGIGYCRMRSGTGMLICGVANVDDG